MALHAELHRHLGGSVVPRILWRYFHRNHPDLAQNFLNTLALRPSILPPQYPDEYLEPYSAESVQTPSFRLTFIYRLIRGAYILKILLLRAALIPPTCGTSEHLSQSQRIDQMAEIVQVVAQASQLSEYPIITSQILCMHSRLPYEVKRHCRFSCRKEGLRVRH